jgi:transcription antitermination factor NusG
MYRRLTSEQQVKIRNNQVQMPDLLLSDTTTGNGATHEEASGTAWFAVQTVYKHEFRALRDLTAKGFTAYLPLLHETRRWTDRTKIIDVPAFSGYLFLRHDSSLQSRSLVLNTFGVYRMLPDNHRPAAIADIEIESLRRTLKSDIPCTKCELPPVGTMVRVKSGVLAGVQGQLVRINNGFRLVILVSSISQAISVEVGFNEIESIANAALRASSPYSQDHLQPTGY